MGVFIMDNNQTTVNPQKVIETLSTEITQLTVQNAMFKARVDDLEKENADLKAANKHTKEDK